MKIVVGQYPPMIEQIDAAFSVRGKEIIFAWDGIIFNPAGIHVTPMLIEHERVHSFRQRRDPEGWWTKYITDQAFRLQEEVYAHGCEYKYRIEHEGRSPNGRRVALLQTAMRLASPIYKYEPPLKIVRAKALILAEWGRTRAMHFGGIQTAQVR